MRHVLTMTWLLGAAVALAARADTINFEVQAAGAGQFLTGIPNSPLTIGDATFTGGELLNGEVGLSSNQTGVYATQGLFGSGETNPLAITFATPVSGFTIQILNAEDSREYTISDNLGDTVTRMLASAGASGERVITLKGLGITSVNIASANEDSWDFAIDNVTFTPTNESQVPEPASALLLLPGLALLGWRIFRR